MTNIPSTGLLKIIKKGLVLYPLQKRLERALPWAGGDERTRVRAWGDASERWATHRLLQDWTSLRHSGLRATCLPAGQPRGVAKAWSEEEEGRFLEALELYGRDWKACSRHLVSRDAR